MFRLSAIPNWICVLRILLVVPLVQCLLAGQFTAALALIVIAGLSDGLDGFLAKQFDWRSRLGGLLDPLADKLLLVSTFVTLAWLGLVPSWLAIVVIARDLVIVTGALTYVLLIGPVDAAPTAISKLNTGLQLVFVVLIVADAALGWLPAVVTMVLGAAVFLASVISGLDYVLSWSARARAARHS